MPNWLTGILGAVGGFVGGFTGGSNEPGGGQHQQPPAAKPVWPWIAGGGAAFVLVLALVLVLGRPAKAA